MAWYYLDAQNVQNGPFEEAAFQALIQKGSIPEHALVYGPGLTEWVSLAQAKNMGVLVLPAVSSGLSLAPDTASLVTCPTCGAQVEPSTLIPLEGRQVCPSCRDVALQQIREGVGVQSVIPEHAYAGFWIRVAATVIDSIVMYAYGAVLQLLFGATVAVMESGPDFSPGMIASLIFYFIFSYAGPLYYTLYFMGHEKHRGTPGMMALKIQIIRPDGSRVGRWRILLRNMASGISLLILGIGYLMVIWDAEKRTLHDIMCDTRVVHK